MKYFSFEPQLRISHSSLKRRIAVDALNQYQQETHSDDSWYSHRKSILIFDDWISLLVVAKVISIDMV